MDILYVISTEILSAFRICASLKCQTTNKVYTLVKMKFGDFDKFDNSQEWVNLRRLPAINMEVTLANG